MHGFGTLNALLFLSLLNSGTLVGAAAGTESAAALLPSDVLGCFLNDYLPQILSGCSSWYQSNGTDVTLDRVLKAAVRRCTTTNLNGVSGQIILERMPILPCHA